MLNFLYILSRYLAYTYTYVSHKPYPQENAQRLGKEGEKDWENTSEKEKEVEMRSFEMRLACVSPATEDRKLARHTCIVTRIRYSGAGLSWLTILKKKSRDTDLDGLVTHWLGSYDWSPLLFASLSLAVINSLNKKMLGKMQLRRYQYNANIV